MLRYGAGLLAIAMAGSLGAQAPDLSLRIETETGRTQFKMGEVIRFEHTPHPVEYEMYYSA